MCRYIWLSQNYLLFATDIIHDNAFITCMETSAAIEKEKYVRAKIQPESPEGDGNNLK